MVLNAQHAATNVNQRHLEIFLLFILGTKGLAFHGDQLHEMSPLFSGEKQITKISSLFRLLKLPIEF